MSGLQRMIPTSSYLKKKIKASLSVDRGTLIRRSFTSAPCVPATPLQPINPNIGYMLQYRQQASVSFM